MDILEPPACLALTTTYHSPSHPPALPPPPPPQGDYVLVFTSRGHARLPSMWIMGAYRSLPRPFRKNVQHIVLVRPSGAPPAAACPAVSEAGGCVLLLGWRQWLAALDGQRRHYLLTSHLPTQAPGLPLPPAPAAFLRTVLAFMRPFVSKKAHRKIKQARGEGCAVLCCVG